LTVGAAAATGAVAYNGAVSGGANTLFGNATSSTIAIGGALTTGTLTLGKTDQTGITVISGSTTGANTLFDNVAAGSISIGTVATGAINIGAGSAVHAITIGSTDGASSIALKAGSGKVIITGVLNATSPVFVTPALGVATATSIALGGGTALTKITVASLADGGSGWNPDGSTSDFTITADAASVAATSFIGVSIAPNATAVSCSVYDQTAATSFKVKCSGNVANAAALNYMIVN